jgi:beta-galactosidase
MKAKLCLYSLLIIFITFSCGRQKEDFSRKQCFDDGWKFHYGELTGATDITLDDSQWRSLDLPHDWSVELPFCKETGEIATAQTVGGTG